MKLAVGISLCVAGVIGFVVFLVTSLLGAFGGMQQVDVPGQRTLDLKPGDYTIYWESPGRGSPPSLKVSVAPEGGGPELPLSKPLVNSRYSTPSVAGFSLLSFSIETEGRYAVSAVTPGFTARLPGSLQVGRSFGVLRLLLTIVGSIAILGVGLGAGVFLIVRSSSASSRGA